MQKNDFLTLLEEFLGSSLASEQLESLNRYLSLLLKWNKAYNLTAITDAKEMVVKHILDSLAINPYLQGTRVIDVGSGAGLPGIPLAIVNPDKHFALLDSNIKKVSFLNQVKLELDLNNIEVVHQRVEKYHPKHCFDIVITRAFSSINNTLMNTKHLCCQEGAFLLMKGAYPQEELEEIPEDFVIRWARKLAVPELEAERHLVMLNFK
jgi:16S rRNA (guanine527-N7)-methyltransferase